MGGRCVAHDRDTPGRDAVDVDRREPVGRVELGLGRYPVGLDPLHRGRQVEASVAEVRVPSRPRLVGPAHLAGVRRQHVLRGHRHQLADLVAAQGILATERLASIAGDQAGRARRLPRVDRAGVPHEHDVRLAPVLGQVRVAEEARRGRLPRRVDPEVVVEEPQELVATLLRAGRQRHHVADARQAARALAGLVGRRVGQRARHVDRLVVVGRVVVVGAVDVAGHERQGHALAVGVGERAPGEGRVAEAAHRSLDDAGPVVGGVDDAHRVEVGVDHEGVPDPHRQQLAVRAQAEPVAGVVALAHRLLGATGAVAVGAAAARGVEGVVVVVEEIPAGDVVDVTVAVVVRAVREGGDQVGAVEHRVRLGVAGIHRDPRVVGEIANVDEAVAVAVIRGARAPVGMLRGRKLGGVEPNLVDQLGVLPADPGVEDCNRHVRVAGRVLPRRIGPHPGDLRAGGVAGRGVGLAALGIELRAVGVGRRALGVRQERQLIRGVGAEAEGPVFLVPVGAAVGRGGVGVVRLAAVEAGVVGGVGARALGGVVAGEGGQGTGGHRQRRDQSRNRRRLPPRAHAWEA